MKNIKITSTELLINGGFLSKNTKKYIYVSPEKIIVCDRDKFIEPMSNPYIMFNDIIKTIKPMPIMYSTGEVYLVFIVDFLAGNKVGNNYKTYLCYNREKDKNKPIVKYINWISPVIYSNKCYLGSILSDYLKEHGIDKKRLNLFYLNGYDSGFAGIRETLLKEIFKKAKIINTKISIPYKFDNIYDKQSYRKNITKIILGTDLIKRLKYE